MQMKLGMLLSIIFLITKFVQMITDKKEGSWVLGGGWNNDLWGGELPMANWIDDITSHNPVRSQEFLHLCIYGSVQFILSNSILSN